MFNPYSLRSHNGERALLHESRTEPFHSIIFAQSIPKTATGKIQRRFVRDAFVKQAREEKGAKL